MSQRRQEARVRKSNGPRTEEQLIEGQDPEAGQVAKHAHAREQLIAVGITPDPDADKLSGTLSPGPYPLKITWEGDGCIKRWGIVGPVPLELAREIYKDSFGRQNVRVDGVHIGNADPEAWASRKGKFPHLTRVHGGYHVTHYHVNPDALSYFVGMLSAHYNGVLVGAPQASA